MSLNTAHANNGVLIHSGEAILLFSENVTMEFSGQDHPSFRGSKVGKIYLTTHRMIFNAKKPDEAMQSFSFPFICLSDVEIEQPVFGANYIRGKVRAQDNGSFVGEAKFKLVFKSGGAIDFAQAMQRAAHMAKQNAHNAAPPPYTPPSGNWYEAPPPAYSPQGNYYGWLPTQVFPNGPAPNSVFMHDSPPPYPGITPPTQQPPAYPQGYPQGNPQGYPQGNPQGNPPGYPQGYPTPQQGYPAPQQGYPTPSQGYPTPPQSSAGIYPNVPNGGPFQPQPQQPAWSNPGFATQGGYPSPYGAPGNSAPPYGAQPSNSAGGFAPPPNSKEAEAAQSANNYPYPQPQQPYPQPPPGYNEPPPSYSSLNQPKKEQ